MIGQVTTVVAAVAGVVRGAGRAGPGGLADSGEWWPGWPKRYACQREGPPSPG